MISVEVTETGVSLSKVASDMPRLAKAILKKAVTHAKGRAEQLAPVRTGLMRQSWYATEQGDLFCQRKRLSRIWRVFWSMPSAIILVTLFTNNY
jgi:hypothetical protein